jgi:hypothetical protein
MGGPGSGRKKGSGNSSTVIINTKGGKMEVPRNGVLHKRFLQTGSVMKKSGIEVTKHDFSKVTKKYNKRKRMGLE